MPMVQIYTLRSNSIDTITERLRTLMFSTVKGTVLALLTLSVAAAGFTIVAIKEKASHPKPPPVFFKPR